MFNDQYPSTHSGFSCFRNGQYLQASGHAVVWALALLLLGLATSGFRFPTPPPDDEGHASFARQVLPVLLGRRALGIDEVQVVADISELLGRDVAVQMLMKDEAFVDHWADTLVDLLEVQRRSSTGLPAQDRGCWGEPTRPLSTHLASWVREKGPSDNLEVADPSDPSPPSPGWNMTDLLRSAIALDDLSPVYRAYLFTLSMRRFANSTLEIATRKALAGKLLRVYLNRDIICLRCHNPTLSVSNKTDNSGTIVWRRLWSVPGHPEKALFGNYYDATAVLNRLYPIMRGDIRKPASDESPGVQPWGMARGCAINTTEESASNDGNVTHHGFQELGDGDRDYENAGFGSLNNPWHRNPKVSLWELERALTQGIAGLKDGYERFPARRPFLSPGEQKYCRVIQAFVSCTGCHSGAMPMGNLDLAGSNPLAELVDAGLVEPGNRDPETSELWRRVSDPSRRTGMPQGGPNPFLDKDVIADWIRAGMPHTETSAACNTSQVPDVNPDEAFAFLTAQNIVDGIWMSVMGSRLTIDHGFPRNVDQVFMLWTLTEGEFVPKGWSLKAVLTRILTSDWFARRAPIISGGAAAYELPPLLDPWVVADPSVEPDPGDTPPGPEAEFNGQGELIHRYRVNTLLRTLAAALGWKKPRPFPDDMYPSQLAQDLGQYISPAIPGFRDVNFQSLLAWESKVGNCFKQDHAVNDNDWFDKLLDAIREFNNDHSEAITIRDVWVMLKDRLLQDPTIKDWLPSGLIREDDAKTEEQALIAFLKRVVNLNVPRVDHVDHLDLNTSTDSLTELQMKNIVKRGCGVLIKTPQFLLANGTPYKFFGQLPRLTVCMDGEPCGYEPICNKYANRLFKMGHLVSCDARRVTRTLPDFSHLGDSLHLITSRISQLCPKGICSFYKLPHVQSCLKTPDQCGLAPLPLTCDPRSAHRANYCGRPVPMDIHDTGIFVVWAEGATVSEAKLVRLLNVDRKEWQTLRTQRQLKAGDLLYVPLQGTLKIKAGNVEFGNKGLDIKDDSVEGIQGHFISVTGPSAEHVLELQTQKGALSLSQLRKGFQEGHFVSRGVSKKDWERIIGYGSRPENMRTPTLEEIKKINEDFESLHHGIDFPKTSPPMPNKFSSPSDPGTTPPKQPEPIK